MASGRRNQSNGSSPKRLGAGKAVRISSGSGLREFLNGVFYSYRTFLITLCAPIILAVLFSTTLHTTFSSEARLLVLLSRQHVLGEGLATAGFGASFDMQSRIVKAESEVLTGRELKAEVVDTVGVANLYPDITESMEGDSAEELQQAAIEELSKNLSVNLSSTSDIIGLRFNHVDPFVAADTLNLIIATFLEHRERVFASDGSTILETRLQKFEAQMADLDYRVGEQRRQTGVFEYGVEMKTQMKRLSELTSKQILTEIRIQGLAARTNELNILKGLIPEEVFSGWSDDGALTALNNAINQRSRLLLEKTNLLNTYKSESRFITDVDNRLVEADKLVDELGELEIARQRSGRNSVYDRVMHELIGLQAQLSQEEAVWEEQAIAISNIEDRLAVLEVAETEYNQLLLERAITIEKIKAYEKRLEKERLARMLEKQHEDPTIRIISKAVPNLEGRDSRVQVVVIGIVCGFVLSLAFVYFSSIGRTVMVTPEEVERTLEVPVLLAIGIKE